MGGNAVIEVKDLVKVYDDRKVLKGINFQVYENEVFGLLGENGAGKTTTLEIIEGLRKASSGTATVLGLDSEKDISRVKERIGVQLQASAYFENLTLIEILELFRSFYGKGREAGELLELVDLGDRGKMRVSQLSGGMKQRFSIVAALVNDPDVVFLDEPTTGLDPVARHNLWDLVRKIESQGKTVILTSHYMEEVEALCARVAIVKEGEILAMDNVANLILQAGQPRPGRLPAPRRPAGRVAHPRLFHGRAQGIGHPGGRVCPLPQGPRHPARRPARAGHGGAEPAGGLHRQPGGRVHHPDRRAHGRGRGLRGWRA